MRTIRIVQIVFIFSLFFFLSPYGGNTILAEDLMQDTIQMDDQKEELSNDEHAEVLRLKKDKNDLIDQLAKRRLNMISLAAVLTLVSCFLVLFIFMFLRLKRRYRIDIDELAEQIQTNQK